MIIYIAAAAEAQNREKRENKYENTSVQFALVLPFFCWRMNINNITRREQCVAEEEAFVSSR